MDFKAKNTAIVLTREPVQRQAGIINDGKVLFDFSAIDTKQIFSIKKSCKVLPS